MRIIQIIDSLEAGGAERMAVSYANALADAIDFSGLVVSRKEGALSNQIDEKVSYLFLNKKRLIDFKAILRLRRFVQQHKVTHVQAHSTSFFLAFLVKLSCPSLQLIWHDHYGDSEFLDKRPILALRMTLPFFSGIVSVNQKLKEWTEQKIKFKKVIYLPNFAVKENAILTDTILKGKEGKRIVCLANLREQKNHFLLLHVAEKLKESHPDWTFHLVGKDFEDDYASKIKQGIQEFNLENTVFIYGTKQDVANILNQSEIAILTSQSEGLPVALLEYGLSKKAVVVTDVGEIPMLIQNEANGLIVDNHDEIGFYNALVHLIENEKERVNCGNALHHTILANYSSESVMKLYLNWLKTI
jgi:glycosyltransferase involved in cell wall biosynthesis